MSRGHGRWQRLILDTLQTEAAQSDDGDVGVVITSTGQSVSLQVCLRRAAYSLARDGLVTLGSEVVEGRRRLVVYPPTPTDD